MGSFILNPKRCKNKPLHCDALITHRTCWFHLRILVIPWWDYSDGVKSQFPVNVYCVNWNYSLLEDFPLSEEVWNLAARRCLDERKSEVKKGKAVITGMCVLLDNIIFLALWLPSGWMMWFVLVAVNSIGESPTGQMYG